MVLVLFTASYPYDIAIEQTFLIDEVNRLAKDFDKVVLVPRRCEGTKFPLPSNVNVVEDYSAFLEKTNKFTTILRVIFSSLFYRDLLAHPWVLFHLPSLGWLVHFICDAYLTEQWVERWLDENKINVSQCIFYTYWFDFASMGIGLAKRHYPDIKLVSRTHGYDLYEERYSPPYWPGRPTSFKVVDLLLPDSDAGLEYLKKRYPDYSSKYEVARLGVTDPGFISAFSSDGVFRIVSCSIIRPVKRLELLLEGIAFAARQRPEQKIEWHHFGNSGVKDVREKLQIYADEILPFNARAFFPGYSTQKILLDYYHTNPVDVFFNVSISEGTPVSSMEAISCGIPIIATSVGGNSEVVTQQNGLLIPPDPSLQEIADAIFKFIDESEWASLKRTGSRALWSERYNVNENLRIFIERLKSVREAVDFK